MKILKSMKVTIALILTLTIALLVPANAAAAANNGKYVSEVYVAYGKDADSARRALEVRGFIAVEGNLNYNGDTYVMMGYKTTDDIRESITDLAVMNMRGDYSVENYKTFLKTKKNEIAEFLTEFMAVIREYRANLKAGKAKATYVHDMLNSYTEDDSEMKMGDLLNSETLQDKVGVIQSIDANNPDKLPDLITILMQGNTQVIKSIELLLSMATDTADNTWLERFASLDYDALLDKVGEEREDLNTETKRKQYVDNLYGKDAAALSVAAVKMRESLNDYAASKLHIDTATDEDIKNTFGDIEKSGEALIQYQEWVSIGTIYEGLKAFEGGRFKKGEMLDFFLKENDPEDIEIYIPMAASLSDGQRYGLPFVTMNQLLRVAFTTEEGWRDIIDQAGDSLVSEKTVSVYQNINRDLFRDNGSVALTGAAQRAKNTADGSTGTERQKMATISVITAISWTATFGAAVATVIAKAYRTKLVDEFTHSIAGGKHIADYEEIIFNENTYDRFVKSMSRVKDGGADWIARADRVRFADMISDIFACVTMVLAVITAIVTFVDMVKDPDIQQLPIPNYLVDNYTDADGGSYGLNYKAVECNRMEYYGADYKVQNGNCADLLADEGRQWLVLYASKNSKAGRPITPDIVVQDDSTAPKGCEGAVHLIGEKGAVNIVSNAFKLYSTRSQTWQNIVGDYTMYIFTNLSSDVKTYDESAGNMTASTLEDGMWAIFGFGGLVIGGALGAVIAIMINKNKKKKETQNEDTEEHESDDSTDTDADDRTAGSGERGGGSE